MSGLAFADWLRDDDYLIVEAEEEIGGYCRTIRRDGFVWDYSGHFFHFRNPEIERYLVERMSSQRVLRVKRDSRIWYAGRLIDFPFQRNVRQLPEDEYRECVDGLRSRTAHRGGSFEDMIVARYGRGIAEKFLIPYNEKLYSTDLGRLDAEAMGRFFPQVSVEEILDARDDAGAKDYNAEFTYPEGGAAQYVEALARGVHRNRITTGERVVAIDLDAKVATTTRRKIRYDALISSAPLIRLLEMCELAHDPGVFSHNQVLVFNLGFDRKGTRNVHWIYYPQRELSFYRVGFYDNIFGADRMSLYVEIAFPQNEELSDARRRAMKARVMADLEVCGIVTNQRLVASQDVLLNPAYVHITRRSIQEAGAKKTWLASRDIHSIGRYGSWTYCSIEDNIVEARALADALRD